MKKEKGKSEERKLTEVQLSPSILNTFTAQSFLESFAGEVELTEAVTVMQEKSDKVIAGDLNELESTLTAQVVSLNEIFSALARRSANNMGHDLKIVEIYMRLALKAQAQCARTIEVLSTIKNPPVIYAKQANIAHGHQQVNNGSQPTHAGKNLNSQNELLNEDNNATLDARRTKETSSVNQEMEAGYTHQALRRQQARPNQAKMLISMGWVSYRRKLGCYWNGISRLLKESISNSFICYLFS